VTVGADVFVVKKDDQRTGRETGGVVSRLLTRAMYHSRGIKVMLECGAVGRVTRLIDDDAATMTTMIPKEGERSTIPKKKMSLSDYLREEGVDEKLSLVLMAAADASSKVAAELRRLPLVSDEVVGEGDTINVQGEEQKVMDVRANELFLRALMPCVASMVSEEEEDTVVGYDHGYDDADDGGGGARYAVAFDPLDGSSNLDAAGPTGSIFGVYRHDDDDYASAFAAPPRRSLVAAGYALYSSSAQLVLSVSDHKAAGFALDPDDDDSTYRLTNPRIACPQRGRYYSLNEAREPDWPDGLRRWIHDAKRGRTPSDITHSARYARSLAADFHGTLLGGGGGWCGNPRPHLRLLYEAAPLAFIAEAAGGKGSDGTGDLLDVMPDGLHGRVCCFLGSKLDVEDLEAYGDVQQSEKRYEA